MSQNKDVGVSCCLENSQGERNMKVNGSRKCNEDGREHMLSKAGWNLFTLVWVASMM